VDLRGAEDHLLGLELFGMRFGLDRMHRLTTALGLPQRQFASVHVVGSNGKSSTTRMIAAILQRHGLRTGSYTSPHLGSFVERIEVDERPVEGVDFAAAVTRVARAAELVERTLEPEDRITQFELLTAAAYHLLARHRVDVAVIEAGLGGRHDATNVIPSRVQVLTGVALEHTRWLGPTLADIAEEKLAVVPDHGCLVVAELPAEARRVAERVVRERRARLVRAHPAASPPVAGIHASAASSPVRPKDPAGHEAARNFQQRNFALAVAAAEAFHGPLDGEALERAAAETVVPGRLELVGEHPLEIHDGAHNPAGAAALAEALPEMIGGRPLVIVMSVLDDKDARAMLSLLLPLCERAVFTACANPRALPPETLESLAADLGQRACESVADPRAAVERAREAAGAEGAVLVTGSIHLLGDLVRAPANARAPVL